MTIQNSAVLCSVKLNKMGNSRKDKAATDAYASSRNASKTAVKVSKELLPDNHYLSEITKVDEQIRESLRNYGLPWDKANWLLPTAHFSDFQHDVDSLMRVRELLVTDFVQDYPAAVVRAQAQLGDMYNPEDYPHQDDVADTFQANIVYAPIPTSGDFRIDMEAQALAELAANYESALHDKQRAMALETWDRVRAVALALNERLTDDPTAKVTKAGHKMFRDTLVTNAEDIIRLLDGFNLTNDPDIHRVRAELSQALDGVTPDALRNNAALRQEVAVAAGKVLRTAESVMDKFGFCG